MDDSNARIILDETYRSCSRHLYARLVRSLGDFDIAEDALQDAVRAASQQWPERGVPLHPEAWLFQTARFCGITNLRRRQRHVPLEERPSDVVPNLQEVGDEYLRLVFTCCHPSISPDAQVALTLREVCELTTEEIATAFLASPPTIAQRIVRAKAKLREAAVPFEVPGREELPARLQAVLKTIYLVFNEGYSSSSGKNLMRADLMSLAIHLGRQLVQMLPEPEVNGLLALMLVHSARNQSRTSPEGEIVIFEDQDRSLWDRHAILEASELVTLALRSGRHGTYSIQAAIAVLYAEAQSYAETDWNEIIGLYNVLIRLEPSPVAALNRAVAVAMRDGPEAGIVLIDELLHGGALAGYHRAYVARGELYRRHGVIEKARTDFETALALTHQDPEKRILQRRLSELLR